MSKNADEIKNSKATEVSYKITANDSFEPCNSRNPDDRRQRCIRKKGHRGLCSNEIEDKGK